MTRPRAPSTMTLSPSFTCRLMSESPSTAGISLDRARMAVWEVLPPASAAMPSTSARSRPRVSDGMRLCVTRMTRSVISDRRARVRDSSAFMMRLPASRKSTVLSRR